jgi:ribose transport system ATP-binding protein
VLTISGISKSFFGVRVLTDFNISIADGEVHALLGHNGSGKSTLIKILSGYYQPDEDDGIVAVDDHRMRLGDTASSASLGIGVVHQGLSLIPSLTVLENLRLGPGQYATAPGRRIRWRAERARALAQLAEVGLTDVLPEAQFAALSTVQQTGVAIARARHEGVRCLILDEPTSALPDSEVGRLISIIRSMQQHGVSIMYVTHRLDEVARVAQQVTVLRDGKIVGSGPVADYPQAELIRLIINPSVADPAEGDVADAGDRGELTAPEADAPRGGGTDLGLSEVSGGTLHGLTLTARAGSVVGVAGLVGSGVEDLPRILQGDLPHAGEIRIGEKAVRLHGPKSGQAAGLVVVPSRVSEKIVEDLEVGENLTLGLQGRFFRRGKLNHRAERKFTRELIKTRGIRTRSISDPARLLSGGNKQKVVMARALELAPAVLVVSEPTNGIDVAGKKEILHLLTEAAQGGTTVVLCSSELEDLADACTELYVLADGRIKSQLSGADITRERILEEMHSDAH